MGSTKNKDDRVTHLGVTACVELNYNFLRKLAAGQEEGYETALHVMVNLHEDEYSWFWPTAAVYYVMSLSADASHQSPA